MKTALFLGIAVVIAVLATGSLFSTLPSPAPSSDSSLPVIAKAADLEGIAGWINTEPFTLEDHRGKVVLVDFWTYSCINCIRTLPYLVDWHDKYAEQGLVIVGVHTPEFEFEKSYDNVVAATEEHDIRYPVVQDNDYRTWRAYKNSYWPRKYLVDREGNIRYDHIGEGAYEETEAAIVELLNEITSAEMEDSDVSVDPNLGQVGFGITGEVYAGYARGTMGSPEGYQPGQVVLYQEQQTHLPGKVYFSGPWLNQAEYMELQGTGSVTIRYSGSVANVVLASESNARVEVKLDGQPLTETTKGSHVSLEEGQSFITVQDDDLFNLVGKGAAPGDHTVTLSSDQSFQVYAYTFGI